MCVPDDDRDDTPKASGDCDCAFHDTCTFAAGTRPSSLSVRLVSRTRRGGEIYTHIYCFQTFLLPLSTLSQFYHKNQGGHDILQDFYLLHIPALHENLTFDF